MTQLSLDGMPITDNALEKLAGMKKLEILTLGSTGITDDHSAVTAHMSPVNCRPFVDFVTCRIMMRRWAELAFDKSDQESVYRRRRSFQYE